MDKNTLTGLLLMGAVILGFTWLNRPSEEELAARMAEQTQAEQVSEKNQSSTTHEPEAIVDEGMMKPGEQASKVVLANDLLRLEISERGGMITESLNFAQLGKLTFFEPDYDELPCLRLALECAKRGGTAPCILSAANEAAVWRFLDGRIGYNEISVCVERALSRIEITDRPTLEDIRLADAEARKAIDP